MVEGLRRRDRRTWAAFVGGHADPLQSLAMRVLDNVHDAEEIVQETFLAVLKGIDSFESRSSLNTWVFKIARNLALDRWRHRRRRAGQVPLDTVSDDNLPHEKHTSVSTEREMVVQSYRRAAMREFIERLSPEDRLLLNLRLIEELPWSEIGQRVGRSPGTCRVDWCRRIEPELKKFRQRVEEEIMRYLQERREGDDS
jgi:RNA polymerase sigma-70 factor (ECF subfamily)